MIKIIRLSLLFITGFTSVFLLSSCDSRIMAPIPESVFDLSPDSRLPKWFAIPPGYSREKITVQIWYYSPLWGNDIKVVFIGPAPDFKELASKVGKGRQHPSVPDTPEYPHYKVVNIDGIDEIIEHKWKGNIVYIADAPALSEQERFAVLGAELSRKEAKLTNITKTGDRFFELEAIAELSFAALQYDEAAKYSKELIDLAAKCPEFCLSKDASRKGKEILRQIYLIKKGKT